MRLEESSKTVYGKKYLDYQLKRGKLRKFVRGFYLRNYKKYLRGATIDFGCGSGDLLAILDRGSLGIEINKEAVDYVRKRGLKAELYRPVKDGYGMNRFLRDKLCNMSICHVMEHLKNPVEVWREITEFGKKADLKVILMVVPGKKGFDSDKSHCTFIDMEFIKKHSMEKINGFELKRYYYFPINMKWFGNIFTHNETIFVYEKSNDRS